MSRDTRFPASTPGRAHSEPGAVVHVYLGFTPFHLLLLRQLLRAPSAASTFLFHPDLAHDECPDWVDPAFTILGRTGFAAAPRGLHYLVAARQLKALLRRGVQLHAFLPHPYNPLANFLFFSPGVTARHIYEDGVLNYYDAEVGVAHPAHGLRQTVRAALLGLPYRRYRGHITGFDARVIDFGYFTRPDSIVGKQRFREIRRIELPRPEGGKRQPSGRQQTLFLDQPIESEMPAERARALRAQAAAFCEQLAIPVVYKPHPAQRTHRTRLAGWKELAEPERTHPAEFIVIAHDIANVVGFFSSALVNIALANPQIRCFAIGCGAMPVRADGADTTLAEIFRTAGVVTID